LAFVTKEPKPEKVREVAELKQILGESATVILTDY
jgi:hypothetical protein